MKSFLLADDQIILRLGIKYLIKENFVSYKIDEAESQTEIMQLVKNHVYDLVIFDISMTNVDFIQVIGWIKAISPITRILIFTMHTDDLYGNRCFQLGAWGFLRKTARAEELLLAIKMTLEGKKYVSPSLAELLSQNLSEKILPNPFDELSSRELEIVLLLDKGKKLSEICNLLNIHYSTVNTHKRNIFHKLMVDNVLSLSRLMKIFNMVA